MKAFPAGATGCVCMISNLKATPWGRCCYAHFADEETEAWGEVKKLACADDGSIQTQFCEVPGLRLPSYLETSSRKSERQNSWPYGIIWGWQSCRGIPGIRVRCGALFWMHRHSAALPGFLAALCAGLCPLGLLG